MITGIDHALGRILTALEPQTSSDALFNGTNPAGLGPFRDLDGDACGDVASADGENSSDSAKEAAPDEEEA